jgi:type VI protein secretion system component VasF
MLAIGMVPVLGHAQMMGKPGSDYALSVMEQERLKAVADQRQKKLIEDAQHLLAMAQTLKTSVDATKKDELSVEVIREADQIEKLAKDLKERMKQ